MANRSSHPAQSHGQAQSGAAVSGERYPELVDITASTGITFEHLSSPEQKYIIESMSGGVALIDYDRDGWTDIYFTNAQSVEMALHGKKARSALYRNNHDGTFTDVTDKSGVGYPCSAQGAVVGDYNNDGFPDLLVTCFGGVVLYRNNGDGTFTDVTRSAGLGGDTLWATGLATMTATVGQTCLFRITWIFIWTIWPSLVQRIRANTSRSRFSAARGG